MSWLCVLPTRKRSGQQGVLSPFMFGLLIGMSIFSALSMQWARRELTEYEAKQAARAQRQADDIVKAMEFAALTETQYTYSEDFDLDRARAYSSLSTGKTRGGQDFILAAREDGEETFGNQDEKIAITSSDDTLLRSKVFRVGDADEISQLAGKENRPVAVLDTGSVRGRQVRTSNSAMEGLAEQVYAFYAAHMRFPTDTEFRQLHQRFPYVDAWGRQFDYIPLNENEARLEFTTPWNYTQTIKLSLQ